MTSDVRSYALAGAKAGQIWSVYDVDRKYAGVRVKISWLAIVISVKRDACWLLMLAPDTRQHLSDRT